MNNIKRLPDSYAKGKESNNNKLLYLNEQAVADVNTDTEAVLNALDLQQATGRTLDLYGEIVNQRRGGLNDVQYRLMILTRVGINIVQGNYETIIAALKQMFQCEASEIIIRDSDLPCRVDVETFPLKALVEAGFTSRQAVEMIESLLPVGVVVNDANFEGTFEFADTADVYDETRGFADIEQTIGGTLGLLLGDDENSPVLPF